MITVQRPCDVCGRAYEAKRANSRYCSDTCRKRSQRAGGAPTRPPPVTAEGDPLIAAIERELEGAGRLTCSAGQRALHLARLLAAPTADSGSAKAALDKQLAAAMAQALDGAKRAADPLDELQARRERRRA